MANHKQKNTEFKEVYGTHEQIMFQCMGVCISCAKKCIDEDHKKTAALCLECSDVCALAIKALSNHSEFEHEIMQLCAHICARCAEECNKIKDPHCKECAEVCKRCAEACSMSHA